jgi:hypothetical protein
MLKPHAVKAQSSGTVELVIKEARIAVAANGTLGKKLAHFIRLDQTPRKNLPE